MMAIEKGHWSKGGSMPESPEITGNYRCPQCGNTEQFIGHDDHGYPGDACECESRLRMPGHPAAAVPSQQGRGRL
jgi:DNA-directed RNA polymerase subunit RPC12/RpoP